MANSRDANMPRNSVDCTAGWVSADADVFPGVSFDFVVSPLRRHSWRTVTPLREAIRLRVSPFRMVYEELFFEPDVVAVAFGGLAARYARAYSLLAAGSKFSRLLVGLLVECVCVGVDCLVRKVKYGRRVDWYAHVAGLEMEVRTETAPGIASECDGFSNFNVLVGLDENFGEVTINGFEAVGMA